MKDSIGYKVFKVINAIVLILIVIATVYPFWNVVVQSFSSENAITAGNVVLTPVGFNLETYKYVMNDPIFWINYKNTIIYTVVGTAISLFLTTTLAYVTSKKYLPGRKFFIGLSVFTMFFAGGLIPNYLLIKSLGWMNTMWAVTVPGALSIFNMLIMKSFFESMPDALEEAAIIDGATPFQILMRIILPLSKPILATMVLFYAVGAWNAWFGAFLYMDNKNLFPVSVYLRNLVKGATGAEAQSADEQSQVSSNIKAVTMVLTVLPVLVVYPFCQKYFVNGIMIGSVKG